MEKRTRVRVINNATADLPQPSLSRSPIVAAATSIDSLVSHGMDCTSRQHDKAAEGLGTFASFSLAFPSFFISRLPGGNIVWLGIYGLVWAFESCKPGSDEGS